MSYRLKAVLAFVAIGLMSGPAWAQYRAAPTVRHGGGARPEVVRPDEEESLQWAASVVVVDTLRHQGNVSAKLFGDAGGDPAMNGLNTYIAFFDAPPVDGWRVFEIGDFLTYRILSESPGRLNLEIRESVMNQRTGDIGSRVRRLLVTWTAGRGGEPPATINVATVR
jgi:hypothetical protein